MPPINTSCNNNVVTQQTHTTPPGHMCNATHRQRHMKPGAITYNLTHQTTTQPCTLPIKRPQSQRRPAITRPRYIKLAHLLSTTQATPHVMHRITRTTTPSQQLHHCTHRLNVNITHHASHVPESLYLIAQPPHRCTKWRGCQLRKPHLTHHLKINQQK